MIDDDDDQIEFVLLGTPGHTLCLMRSEAKLILRALYGGKEDAEDIINTFERALLTWPIA